MTHYTLEFRMMSGELLYLEEHFEHSPPFQVGDFFLFNREHYIIRSKKWSLKGQNDFILKLFVEKDME